MTHQQGRAVSQILNRYFGEIVQKVGDDIFKFGDRPINMIMRNTGLPRAQVIESLRALLKYDLATFESTDMPVIYNLLPNNIMLLIRYPRYLLQIKTKYGNEAEIIVEELLQQASCTATVLLVSLAIKYKDDKEKSITLVKLKDTFISLATAGYIQQAPVAELKEGSDIPTLVPVATIVPDLDVRDLMQAMTNNLVDVKDNIYWKVNYERFDLDLRDDIMIKAITRRIDDNAGEVMRIMLELMYLSSSPWAPESTPTFAVDLRDRARNIADRPLLQQYFDQYLKVIEENGADFVRRVGDAGGGQLVVRGKMAATMLLRAVLDHLVTERLGSNAARIFRLILTKKYIEEEDIQKHAMLPNKQCKELTYKLLEQHFITIQPLRKTATAGGIAKAIYLYNVKLNEVAYAARDMCHAAIHNVARTAAQLRERHARLLDKQRRVLSIVHGMRVRGELQQNIEDVLETLTPPEVALLRGIERQLKQLNAAELELDRSLFIINWYFMYPAE